METFARYHTPWTRLADGDTAVLMVHGIIGTPRHFRFLEEVFPKEWSLYALRLDGHGGTVKEFGETSMKKWHAQVERELVALSERYRRVVLVGHSLGCLLCFEAARKYPERVAAMIWLAAPLRIRLLPVAPWQAIRMVFDLVDPNDPFMMATKDAHGVKTDKRVWRYVRWLPRYVELFSLSRAVRRSITALETPCFVFHSARDEMVSRRTLKELARCDKIRVTELAHARHHYYPPEDRKALYDGLSRAAQWIEKTG